MTSYTPPSSIVLPVDPSIGPGVPLADRLATANAREVKGHRIGLRYRIAGLALPPEKLPRLTAAWFRDGASVIAGDRTDGYQYVTNCACQNGARLGDACGHVVHTVIQLEGLAPTGAWRERSAARQLEGIVNATEPAAATDWIAGFEALWALRGKTATDAWDLAVVEHQRLLDVWRTEVVRQFRNCREACPRCGFPILFGESECQFCSVVRAPLGLNGAGHASPPAPAATPRSAPATSPVDTPSPGPVPLNHELRAKIRVLDDAMLARIAGQDEAIDAVHRVVKRQATGVGNPDKPVGVFLFLGPTGVGKTELAKTCSDVLGWPMKRFDMSEFKDDAAANRFTGSAPGYVGYERGGELTNFLFANQRSVVVFDEFEKANSKIYEVLLQVFDEGRLTDGQGRTTLNGRGAIFIMTSNLGASYYTTREGQALTREDREARIMDVVREHFSPEFLNRIDETVFFNNLDRPVLQIIAGRLLDKLDAQLDQLRQHDVRWDELVVDFLVDHGTTPGMGARPLQRAIDRYVRTPIADLLLDREAPPGTPIRLAAAPDRITATFEEQGSDHATETITGD